MAGLAGAQCTIWRGGRRRSGAGRGICVNARSHGSIAAKAGLRRRAVPGPADALVRSMVPLGRMGTTADMAPRALSSGRDVAGDRRHGQGL